MRGGVGEREKNEVERLRSRKIVRQTSIGQDGNEEPIKTHFKMRVLMRKQR